MAQRSSDAVRNPRPVARFLAIAGLGVTLMAVSASSAAASVTLGQVVGPSGGACLDGYDRVQPPVTSGNTYIVPGTGAITSWSTNAIVGAGRFLTLKIFHQNSSTNWTAGGTDGPRELTPGTLNTFTGISIPVKPGDSIGLFTGPGSPGCDFNAPGDHYFRRLSSLANGQFADFTDQVADYRLNVMAVFEPSNTVALGATTRNQKKGTATLNLTLPNPGDLTASGNGVNAATAGRAVIGKSVTAGPAQLLIKAKGKKRKKLNETGKVKLNVAITYTPSNGAPDTRSVKVKLKKKL